MKVIFLGATKFSEELLTYLIENKIQISAIFSIPEEFHISYSKKKVKNFNYCNLSQIALAEKIKFYEVDSVDGKRLSDYSGTIKEINPDVMLVLGWYFMVPQKIRELSRHGAWGIHASLLPRYAGNAPLVWAIINGERETGVTLFRLDSGVDDGDIISQRAFPVEFNDTISKVYDKATKYAKEILLDALGNIEGIKYKPQDKTKIKVYPPRTPEDGKIDFGKTALEIYNFIRAQTRPYPGAFSMVNGKKIILWEVRYCENIKHADDVNIGEVFKTDGRFFVKTRDGFLEIIKVNYDGKDGDFKTFALKEKLLGKRLGA